MNKIGDDTISTGKIYIRRTQKDKEQMERNRHRKGHYKA